MRGYAKKFDAGLYVFNGNSYLLLWIRHPIKCLRFRGSIVEILFQDTLTKSILHPAIRLMASTKILFPSGCVARSLLASKLIDCLYMLGMRLGHLISKSLQRFFIVFDKLRHCEGGELTDISKYA